jgi:putative transposase
MPRHPDQSPPWPHAPTHLLDATGIYFVTASTYQKQHHFRDPARLEVLHRGLLTVTRDFGWRLEAWAVFSNHYHFVAKSPANATDAESLPFLIRALHGPLARWINKLDAAPDRQVWHNYWETLLTHRTSYLARLNYTHNNAVRHGLVKDAKEYPWCSAGWFERETAPAMVNAIYRFKTDRLRVEDEFEPEWEK